MQTLKLKWPMGNLDKRNDRIQETLRPYRMVIRNKLFQNFIARIFKIDPDLRATATQLLKDSFVTTVSVDLPKFKKRSTNLIYKLRVN